MTIRTRITLTLDLLSGLNLADVVYAEHCPMGAMGDEGTLRMYVPVKGENKLTFYFARFESDPETYTAAAKLLSAHSSKNQPKPNDEKELFDYCPGGMQNRVFLRKVLKFEVLHDKLVYHADGHAYELDPSSFGVFRRVSHFVIERESHSKLDNHD